MSDPSSKGPGRVRANATITVHSVVEVTVRSVRTVTAYLTEKTVSSFPSDVPAFRRPFEPTLRTIWNAPALKKPGLLATMVIQRAQRVSWHKRPGNVDLTAVVAILVLACCTAYSDRHAASAEERAQMRPIASPASLVIPAALIPQPAVTPAAKNASIRDATPTRKTRRVARARAREIDGQRVVHIGSDVTVRYFASARAPKAVPARPGSVVSKGSDVTVRYFNPDGSVRKTIVRSSSTDSHKGAGFGGNALSELRASGTKTPD